MGFKDKNRIEQPKREIAPKGKYEPEASFRPMNMPPVPAQIPTSTKQITEGTQPQRCKPHSNVAASWRLVNAFAKVRFFPGMKIEVGKGVYRDAITNECILLYRSTTPFIDPKNPSGLVFVDDTTEDLFRRYFDF